MRTTLAFLFLLVLVLGGCKQQKPGSAAAPPAVPTVPVSMPETVTVSPYQPPKPPPLYEAFCVYSAATLNGESLKVADTLCLLCGAIDTIECPRQLLVKLGKDTVYSLNRVVKAPSDIFCHDCPAKGKAYKPENAARPL